MYLIKRWEHHTASGGYDRLAREEDGRIARGSAAGGLPYRGCRFAWKILSHSKPYLLDYWFEDWLAEWRLLAKTWSERPEVVHVLYGDEQLDLLVRRRWLLRCPLVATFHLPAERVRQRFERQQKQVCKNVDMAIVVARSQLPDFQNWLGPERVVFIPHGINTARFCPGETRSPSQAIRLISVGHHMRDLESLRRIIDECHHLKLPVEVDVVIRKDRYPHFAGCAKVRLHTGISEEQLINLYREADALLMPLAEATANNALLESMACGTPVISTHVGGIPDYADESAGWLFPKGAVTPVVDLIKNLCANQELTLSRRKAARDASLKFDWLQIRKQVFAAYTSAIEGYSKRQGVLPVGRLAKC